MRLGAAVVLTWVSASMAAQGAWAMAGVGMALAFLHAHLWIKTIDLQPKTW